jgi:hypothetical protein
MKSLASSYEPNAVSIYLGTGGGSLNWPRSFRIYWKEVEFGNYAAVYGLTKIFSSENLYAELGVGLSGFPGLIAGVGYHKIWGAGFGFRADWNSFYAMNTSVDTVVSIGFTYTF